MASDLRKQIAELGQRLEEARRARQRRRQNRLSLAEFAARYLHAEQADGSVKPLTPGCNFHQWLIDELEPLVEKRGARLNVLAPRGSAKTTWASYAYPLHCALYGLERFVVLASDTSDQAQDFLRKIRDALMDNEAIRADFPDLAGGGPIWRDDYLRLRNGVGIKAVGTGGKIRGRSEGVARPSLILVDDPQNRDHIISPTLRQRSWEWLQRDVMNAGSPRTNIVVLGTALHRECIVYRLQTTPGWRSRLFRSIEQMPVRMDLWRKWQDILHDHENPIRESTARAFYLLHREEMDQ